jgi:hypothetical protein
MNRRKITLFVAVLLAWTIAVALVGVLNLPKGVWPYAQAHAPGFVWQVYSIWGLVPATLLVVLVTQLKPVRDLAMRRFNGGRASPPDREKWEARTITVLGLFMAFGQAWQTAALVLLWRRRELPGLAEALRQGPHWAGLPDPHHWIARGWLFFAGVVFAWFGNSLPKLMTPFRGGGEPYDWTQMMRACGWTMTLGSLVAAACALLIPELRAAQQTSGAIFMLSLWIAPVVIWLGYKFGGGRPTVAPPAGG